MTEQSRAQSSRPEAVRNRKTKRQTYLSFPSVPMPHGFQMIFKEYDYSEFVSNAGRVAGSLGLNRQITKNTPIATEQASIELPFPRTLTDSNSIRVSSFERDFITERIAGVIGGVQTGSVSNLPEQIKGAANAIAGKIEQFGAAAANPKQLLNDVTSTIGSLNIGNAARIATYILRNYLPADLAKSVNAATGAAINPNETLAFDGVDLRSYSFSWDLFPSSKSDSEQIRQIIRFLKLKTLPRTSSEGLENLGLGGLDVSRAFLRYPNVVLINLLGVDETHWMRFKPAMVKDINVDYGAGGSIGVLEGGKPAGVTLTIGFSELSIHTANDYEFNSFFVSTGN